MSILLLFAFLSGLITIFAPCIWPLLPIILSSTTSGGKRKPLGITLGIISSFAVFTLTISYIVKIIPFDPDALRMFAVIIIGFLGLMLIIPKLSQVLEGYVSRFSGKFSNNAAQYGDGFISGFITGFSLGIVWTPCAGPILATIATLAATQAVNFQVILVTFAYVIGVGISLFIFATLGRTLFSRSRLVNRYTGRIQQVFGVIMILTAFSIFTGYDRVLQAKLLDLVPYYSHFITTLESNDAVKKQLNQLKGKQETSEMERKPLNMLNQKQGLQNYGKAPEFAEITQWLNADESGVFDEFSSEPSLAKLKGKVVLVDFWTYTCINCIRTLPHVTKWYETYKDENFVVIGVHTPEFEFEKKTENVQNAIKQYGIHYPVAQDNDFVTWDAYNNHYWPAKYLIDAEGNIRYFHFGEGKYDETEEAIRSLLKEAGQKVSEQSLQIDYSEDQHSRTPETYLGLARSERFASIESLEVGEKNYTFPPSIALHTVAYQGRWNVTSEFSAATKGSRLQMRFEGNKVFLVIHPKNPGEKVKVLLDGTVVSAQNAGKDVKDGFVTVTMPDLYELIDLKGNTSEHILEIEFENDNTEVYAFTFG